MKQEKYIEKGCDYLKELGEQVRALRMEVREKVMLSEIYLGVKELLKEKQELEELLNLNSLEKEDYKLALELIKGNVK